MPCFNHRQFVLRQPEHKPTTAAKVAVVGKIQVAVVPENRYDCPIPCFQDLSNYTALHYCAQHGQIESCKYLISNGATLNIINDEGKTAEDLAREHNFVGLYFYLRNLRTQPKDLNEDWVFLSEAVNNSASRISEYVDHIMKLPSHASLGGPMLEKNLEKLGNSSKMSLMYQQLDNNLRIAKSHAHLWNGVFNKQQETFMDIKSFGSRFLTSFKNLDQRVPGAMRALKDSDIKKLVDNKERALKRLGMNSRQRKKEVKEFESELKSNVDLWLEEIVDLMKHVKVRGDVCVNSSSEAAEMMSNFSYILAEDEVLFENDRKILDNLKTATEENLNLELDKLKILKGNSTLYEKEIERLTNKTKVDVQKSFDRANLFVASNAIGTLWTIGKTAAEIVPSRKDKDKNYKRMKADTTKKQEKKRKWGKAGKKIGAVTGASFSGMGLIGHVLFLDNQGGRIEESGNINKEEIDRVGKQVI